MASFSRKTVLAVTDIIAVWGHSHLSRFELEHGLEDKGLPGGSRRDRANGIARYLLSNPDGIEEDGRSLIDAVVEEVAQCAISDCNRYGGFQFDIFRQSYPVLFRALDRDGFTVEDGHLRRALPQALDLPQADDEVHALLGAYGFDVPTGHLDQGIAAHSRGDWAAANAQFRPFVEGLFDEIAATLAGGGPLPPTGEPRRQWLAQLNPPFFFDSLNEWRTDGKGFFQTFYRRLHPQGAHPGLSDEEDSTFRLHLVLLISRLILPRLRQRLGR